MSLADRARARALAKLAAAAGSTAPIAEASPPLAPATHKPESLAARNRDRRAAEKLPPRAAAVAAALAVVDETAPAPVAEPPADDERTRAYRMKLVELAEDRRLLKNIQSLAGKIALKREMLPKYAPWIEGILAAEANGGVIEQDEVFTTVMIWRIDAGDFAGAMPLADYALRHKLALPDRYKRDVATTVAEEIANAALKALTAGDVVDLEALHAAATLTAGHDMPDEVRAKLLKAQGLALAPAAMGKAEVTEALGYLTKAFDLNPKIGVKKEIEGLRRELAKLEGASQSNNGGASA